MRRAWPTLSLLAAVGWAVLGEAAAAVPVLLPPQVDPEPWATPLSLAGLVVGPPGEPPFAVVTLFGDGWMLLVADRAGTVHRVELPVASTVEDREEIAFLVASLVEPPPAPPPAPAPARQPAPAPAPAVARAPRPAPVVEEPPPQASAPAPPPPPAVRASPPSLLSLAGTAVAGGGAAPGVQLRAAADVGLTETWALQLGAGGAPPRAVDATSTMRSIEAWVGATARAPTPWVPWVDRGTLTVGGGVGWQRGSWARGAEARATLDLPVLHAWMGHPVVQLGPAQLRVTGRLGVRARTVRLATEEATALAAPLSAEGGLSLALPIAPIGLLSSRHGAGVPGGPPPIPPVP